ncbi:MAG: hypothetical protein JWN86_3099 [Planctomycetota bacterium]|nr:hypothetical protein [Planctomycetota bacterium]
MPRPRHPRIGPWIVVGWIFLILAVCWTPANRMPIPERQPLVPHLDKVIHFGMFAVLGLLAGWAGILRGRTIMLVALGVGLAITSELGQATRFVARDADVWDALADIVGAVCGLAVAASFAGGRSERSSGATEESGPRPLTPETAPGP